MLATSCWEAPIIVFCSHTTRQCQTPTCKPTRAQSGAPIIVFCRRYSATPFIAHYTHKKTGKLFAPKEIRWQGNGRPNIWQRFLRLNWIILGGIWCTFGCSTFSLNIKLLYFGGSNNCTCWHGHIEQQRVFFLGNPMLQELPWRSGPTFTNPRNVFMLRYPAPNIKLWTDLETSESHHHHHHTMTRTIFWYMHEVGSVILRYDDASMTWAGVS